MAILIYILPLIALAQAQLCKDNPEGIKCTEPNSRCDTSKDWDLQILKFNSFVTWTVSVPQFRRQQADKIVIGLFGDIVPFAATNFAQFSAGGIRDATGSGDTKVYSYVGTPFHRISKDVSISGGDVVYKNGTGSVTIYNASSILPDNYWISNFGKGWVGMVENGPGFNHSIGCQFFISMTNDRKTLQGLNSQPIMHLGKVIEGMALLERINERAGARGPGRIRLDESVDPLTGAKKLRPLGGDITITASSYQTAEQSRGRQLHTFNRPSSGCLTGRWPKPLQ